MSKVRAGDALGTNFPSAEVRKQSAASFGVPSSSYYEPYNYSTVEMRHLSSNLMNEEESPSATSEKDLGNEYFKQKNYVKAIECYSRSIALSPTSIAFANRAMAYLKVKRYKDAEDDCTEALNLDDRYVKAYSRRATARKELGKLKESLEDSDFALRLEPNNQELKKLYTETKALYDKEMMNKITSTSKIPQQGVQISVNSKLRAGGDNKVEQLPTNGSASAAMTAVQLGYGKHADGKNMLQTEVQDLASRAVSLAMVSTPKNIKVPKSAYEFEVSWRSLSDDSALQSRLLKSIPPATLPQLFKNALTAPILVDIVKCVTIFCIDEPDLAVSILDNLSKVSRFDMVVMCLSFMDRADLRRIWDDVFSSNDIPAEQQEALRKLQPRFCPR